VSAVYVTGDATGIPDGTVGAFSDPDRTVAIEDDGEPVTGTIEDGKWFIAIPLAQVGNSVYFKAVVNNNTYIANAENLKLAGATGVTLLSPARLLTVLGKNITAGSEEGTAAAPKTATIVAGLTTTAVKSADITPTNGATVKLFAGNDFTGSEADESTGITLTADQTKEVYILVTAADGSTKLYYKVTIVCLEDVSSDYALGTYVGSDSSASGLTISATKNSTGAVTVYLTGTLDPEYVYTADGIDHYPRTDPPSGAGSKFLGQGFWIGVGQTVGGPLVPTAGKYAQIGIKGLYTGLNVAGKVVAVKQSNHALRFFSGYVGVDAVTSVVGIPITLPKDDDYAGANYIPADANTLPVRWRVSNTGEVKSDQTQTSTFIIWNGGDGTTQYTTPTTATFELTARASYMNDAPEATPPDDIGTVTVDYSGVIFN
jgi:hypothetical protein